MIANIKKIQNVREMERDFLSSGFSSSSSKTSRTYLKNLSIKSISLILFLYGINFYFIDSAFATNYHIAVNGKSTGDGSKGNPWDIRTGISGKRGSAGDTIFLHGGVYKGQFVSEMRGTSGNNIVLAQYPGETAILDGFAGTNAQGTLTIRGAYATYYGFQVMSSSSKRVSSIAGSRPTDLFQNDGIEVFGSYVKLVSLIVRDNVGEGIGFWKAAVNSEVNGCIVYNNGWQGPDRGHGHGIYTQNDTGTKLIRDNVIFGGFGRGIQVYGVNGGLNGFNMNGNIIFNSGSLSRSPSWNIIIGGESKADNVLVQNNYLYKDISYSGKNAQFHYGSTLNGKATFQNNYIVGGDASISIKNWASATVTGNIIYAKSKVLDFSTSGSTSSSSFNNNTYYTGNTSSAIGNMSFDNWKKTYSWDGNSRMSTSNPSNQVVVKPNVYDKGTGFVVVMNNSGSSSVDVDLSKIVSNGAEYEIRDVENMQGQPIISGKYSGGTVRLPMTLTSVDKPNGYSSVRHSDSGIGVFLVRSKGNVTTTAPVVVTNKPPTLNSISNPSAINEDAGKQTINLSGITTGGESQTLKVTATSSNTGLIPTPVASYSSPSSTGNISYTPVSNKSGSATITVTVDDGASSNSKISRTFTVTVNSINDAPALNALSNMTVAANSGTQTVNLSGINAGGSESQTISVTATSSNTGLVPNPSVTYTSPNSSGSLKFTPASGKSGTATITVKVTDSGSGTSPNQNVTTKTFTITVNAPVATANKVPTLNSIGNPSAINEDAGLQTINLSGISAGEGENQSLKVTATSSNTGLIPNPQVTYSSPSSTGSIKYQPVSNQKGTATITVTVNDGQSSNNQVSRTFQVTVNPINDVPTLNNISNITIAADAPKQTVNLSGISAGINETQTISVTATSSNTGLIPNPSVSYTSSSSTGQLSFTPAAGKSGSATITVKVKDGGASTTPHKNEITKTFSVTVNAPSAVVTTNKAPTLNSISSVSINMNASKQTVNLSGISAGSGETQTLTVSATSSNTGLIPNPSVVYSSPSSTGKIEFTPVSSKTGTATITVKVKDSGSGTSPNVNEVTRTFTVTVKSTSTAGSSTPSISKITLINAASNNTILQLTDGATLYTSKLPVRLDQLSIEAFPSQTFSGSIVFGFNGNSKYVIENYPLYAINGNTGDDYNSWNGLKPGVNTISATCYSSKGGSGTAGTTSKVTITIIDDISTNSVGQVLSLQLINASTNELMYRLTEGLVIDVKDLPIALNQLNIRAMSSSTNIGSVVFGFNGNNRYNIEHYAPYVIGGNTKDNYYSWDGLRLGKNTVSATTYSERNGSGAIGSTIKVNFTIVDSRSASSRTAPQVSSIKRSITENEPYSFKKEDFNTAFVDESGDDLKKVKVVSLPATGELQFFGQSVRSGDEIMVEEIENLVYLPNDEVSNDDSFKWNGSNSQIYASNEASVKLIPSSEVEQKTKFEIVRYWPNPVVDKVTIRAVAPAANTVEIVVNNINGQFAKRITAQVQEGENEIELDLTELEGGVYIVSMTNSFQAENFKIIKNSK